MTPAALRKAGIALALIVLVWALGKYILPMTIPFLLAIALALAAEPLVRVFHRRIGLPRGVATGIGVTIALAVTALLVITLCAFLLRELQSLAGVVPDLADSAVDGLHSMESFLLDLAHKTPESIRPALENGVTGLFSDGSQVLEQTTSTLMSAASGVVKALPDGALGFGTWIIASFMISARLPQITVWLRSQLPESWNQRYLPALKRMKKNLSGWLLAQLKLTGVTFCVLCVGFVILQISYAPLWAVMISLVDALPILGTGMVLVPWSLISMLQGDQIRAIGLLGVYAVAALTRSVLEPKLVGKQLGLDPLVTLVAMYAGYRIWGIFGMILAPLLAVTLSQVLIKPKEA